MSLALVLVIAAALALVFILGVTVSTRLQLSPGSALARRIEPIDIEAFRNLVSPTEDEYLRRRLPPGEFRRVQRERLRAAAAYIRVAGRNAAVLIAIGQPALAASDTATVEAARQLVAMPCCCAAMRRSLCFASMSRSLGRNRLWLLPRSCMAMNN